MSKWYEESIFYHIYPLGMCGAEERNEGQEIIHRFTELEEWLPHIKNIGCNAIYIGPLFESVAHGYDTIDYYKVDRRLGMNQDFKKYVDMCHTMGIKVVVDGVFNHTGRDFFAFLDLKEKKEQSKYKDWYRKIDFSKDSPFRDGFSYEGWRGAYDLVTLNLKNSEVIDYLFDVIRYWIEEFDIDGIRLDCADILDFEFMKKMRKWTDGLKEDFWLMGEVIHGTYSRWANDEMLHSVTNYELHQAFFSSHNTHNYFEIAHTAKRLFDADGGICKNQTLYSFVDNHDVNRIASKVDKKDFLIPIHILLYTLPGIPSIYYGSEFCIEGKLTRQEKDYILRPKLEIKDYIQYNGEKILYKQQEDFIQLIQKLAQIHKEYKALSHGSYEQRVLTNRQFAFARKLKDEEIIVIVNNDDEAAEIKIPIKGNKAVDLMTNEIIPVQNNQLCTKVNSCRGAIFLICNK